MKKVIAIIFVLFMLCSSSCNTLKSEYNPINDYLDSLIKTRETVLFVKEKISRKRTIKILNGNFLFDTKNNSFERIGTISKFNNPEDFTFLSKKNLNDSTTYFWSKKDFRRKKIDFIDKDKLLKNEVYKEYNDRKELSIFMFSEPIKFKNNTLLFFTVGTSKTSYSSQISEFIIFMEKKKNKWVIVDKIWAEEDFIN